MLYHLARALFSVQICPPDEEHCIVLCPVLLFCTVYVMYVFVCQHLATQDYSKLLKVLGIVSLIW